MTRIMSNKVNQERCNYELVEIDNVIPCKKKRYLYHVIYFTPRKKEVSVYYSEKELTEKEEIESLKVELRDYILSQGRPCEFIYDIRIAEVYDVIENVDGSLKEVKEKDGCELHIPNALLKKIYNQIREEAMAKVNESE